MDPIKPPPVKQPPPEEIPPGGSIRAGTVMPTDPNLQPAHQSIPTPKISSPEEPKVQTGNSGNDGWRSILMTVAILVLAPLIALALTAFIFQSYQVDGSSMETTLQNADRLIVLKLPRTWAKITHHDYVPHRGDVIIFNKNDLAQYGSSSQKKQLVKRVIGLPGDRVVVKDGTVTIYNSEHPNGFSPDATLPYGKVIVTTPGDIDLTVQKGQLFVMGDNRTNSLDSRIFGPISDSDVVGKLVFRIYPFNKAKRF